MTEEKYIPSFAGAKPKERDCLEDLGIDGKIIIIIIIILIPWSRVLLEKLTGFAANQAIPRILWKPPKFITVLTSARHLSLS